MRAILTMLLLGAAGMLRAEEPLVEVQGQFFHATRAQIDGALEAAKARRTATLFTPEQMEIIRAKLKESGAEIFSEPRATTQGGEWARVKAVREVAYPTEFAASTQEPGKAVPQSFETRNVGVELEVKVGLREDGRLRIEAHPAFTRFLGFVDYASAKVPGDKRDLETLLKAPLSAGGMWRPIFASYSVESTFNMANGQTALMGGPLAVEREDDAKDTDKLQTQGEDVFVFLTASVVPRE